MKDWEGMKFPKNARIKDKKAMLDKNHICEYCGKRGVTHSHHIKTRGAGGNDTKENLIELCVECHNKVHQGNIDKKELLKIKKGSVSDDKKATTLSKQKKNKSNTSI